MNRKIRGLVRTFKQLESFILNPKRWKVEVVAKSRIKPIYILFVKRNRDRLNMKDLGEKCVQEFKQDLLRMDAICLV